VMKARESEFDLNVAKAKLPEYNALFDNNLRHHFENKSRQKQLHKLGMIDADGNVINLAKNRSKLFIIEQEFKAAEKAEYWRMKEEQEMRRRVQKKRHEALEKARLEERLAKMKDDRRIRREILTLTTPEYHLPVTKPAGGRRKGREPSEQAVQNASFFLTEGEPEGRDSMDDRKERDRDLSSINLEDDFY